MSVPNIGQGPGGVITLPRTDAGGEPPRPGVIGRSAALGPSAEVRFTRLAWFDANGDGQIDPRSAGAGGDATLIVPAHAVDLPTYTRPAPASSGARSKPTETGGAATPGNAAQTSRAIDAYQRYGQTPPSAPDVPPAPATPAVAAAAKVAPAPPPAPALTGIVA